MLKKILVCAMLLLMAAPAAEANETGLASIHAWRREAGKTCMIDHFHYGSGSGATKQAAMRQAVVSWTSFTVFEYGTTWGSYNNSAGKIVNCDKSGAGWICAIRSRPCKR
jgi:hypothetical protein